MEAGQAQHDSRNTRGRPLLQERLRRSGARTPGEGILIDPGTRSDELLAAVDGAQLTIRYILLTHAHLDHITGVAAAKKALGAPVGLHRADNFLYEAVAQQGLMLGVRGRAAARRSISSTNRGDPGVSATTAPGCTTRPGIAPVVSASRSDATASAAPDAVRRRHAVRRIDRPHGSSGRRSRDAAAIDPRRAVHIPGRDASSIPATGSRPRSASRRRTNPFL